MTAADASAKSPDWEWSAELERGVSIATGESWRGHRVRYRDRGTRRWRSFLLTVADDVTPTDSMILQAIEAHANASH